MDVLLKAWIITLVFLPTVHLGPLMPQIQVHVDGSSPSNPVSAYNSYYSRHLRNRVATLAANKKQDELEIYKFEISSFGPEQTGLIIVDYITTNPISVKWFKPAEMFGRESGTHHEVPAEGAYRYRVMNMLYKGVGKYMGQTYLQVKDIKDYERKFRVQFAGENQILQKVFEIKENVIFQRELLEHMQFLKTPPKHMVYQTLDQVSITCEVKSPVGFHLSWFRGNIAYPSILKTENRYSVKWDVMYSNSYRLREMQLKKGNVEVDVDMTQSRMEGFKIVTTLHIYKATREDQGFYVCEFSDPSNPGTKLWAGTEVKHRRTEKLLPLQVAVDVQGCDPQPLLKKQGIFGMNDMIETCILCRAYGYPPPSVALYKNNDKVEANERISVDSGRELIGTREMVYTFRDPDKLDSGSYSCRASNPASKSREDFKVIYYSRATARVIGKDVRKLKRPGQVNVTCEVTGSPIPKLTFYELDEDWENGRKVVEGPEFKIFIIYEEKDRFRAKLWIRKVTPTKHYECKADNGLSSDYAYASLKQAS